jgi:hypothetical protein
MSKRKNNPEQKEVPRNTIPTALKKYKYPFLADGCIGRRNMEIQRAMLEEEEK